VNVTVVKASVAERSEFRPGTRRTVEIEPTAQTVRHDVAQDSRPRPVLPRWWRVVKNGSKAWLLTSTLMPQPSSENRISTLSSPDARTLMDSPRLAVRKSVLDRIEQEDRKKMPAQCRVTVYQQIGLALDVER
jgi:hypothetical protein